jgi:hypothetical protein
MGRSWLTCLTKQAGRDRSDFKEALTTGARRMSHKMITDDLGGAA